MEKLYIHLNSEEHYLTTEEFVQIVNATQEIYKDLKTNLIETEDDIKLIILPPEKGSFLIDLAVTGGKVVSSIGPVVAVTTVTTCAFLETEIGKKFIKGLTGNEPGFYAEKYGKLLSDCIKGIYTKNIHELKAIIPTIVNLDASLKAKSNFYVICNSNKGIKSIGFDETENYPIERDSFFDHMTNDIIRELPPVEKIQKLIIEKPTIVEKKGNWFCQDAETKEYLSVSIEDNYFIDSVLEGKNPLKQSKDPDTIVGKVIYNKQLVNGKERKKSTIITDVYKFNDRQLKEMPKDLLNKKVESKDNKQLNIFKDINKKD